MNIPPYWSRARHPADRRPDRNDGVVACGWSFSSLEDARRQAALRAKHIFELLGKGQKPGAYEYSDRPVREEIIEELSDGNGQLALITRNRYGALILNSAGVLFADVDFPPATPVGFREWLAFLFLPSRRDEKRAALAKAVVEGIARWAEANPERSFRMYRTKQGLRLLFTDRLYDPASEETGRILRDLKSDPMYITLTQKQKCFRARLTAKPWRCACPRPPNSYPWESKKDEQAFRQWEKRYTDAEAKFRACEFAREFGTRADIAAVNLIAAAHDKLCRIDADAPLA